MGGYDLRHGEDAPQQAAETLSSGSETGRIICLDIPDDYDFMQPELVRLLKVKMARYFPDVPAPD
ncbi:hypothetical protein [Sphingomonas sp.]|uniref:hypothetical protein n=1 Tax=Sphingomonas sp. TaxID=28214 RepID=UPI003D6D1675